MEVSEASQLVSSITEDVNRASNLIENLRTNIDSSGDKEGIGLLHLKNLQMVDYMTNLLYLMLKKSHGKSIEGDEAIARIVENRTVLEKMRPMEKKLKYQIEKFIRLADNEKSSDKDPLYFKPNLEALDANEDDDDDEVSDMDDQDENVKKGSAGSKKYIVPKHVPALPDDDLTRQEIENEEKAKTKKKTLSKAIVDDLKRQYMDTPEEEFHQSDVMKAKHIASMRDRARYEEDNYMRLPALSKKEKHKRKRSITTVATVGDELTYFGNDNFFNESGNANGPKKRKFTGKKGSAKKKFNKR